MTKSAMAPGGTGMMLRCLLDHPQVVRVLVTVRRLTRQSDTKLRECVLSGFSDLAPPHEQMRGVNICFRCLAVYQSQASWTGWQR